MNAEEIVSAEISRQEIESWKQFGRTKLFFNELKEQREKLLKEAEQLSASQCEEWQLREKLNSARTIRNIITKYG